MLLKYFMFYSVTNVYESVISTLIMFVVFFVYVSTSDNELTPRKVFVSLSLINFLRVTSIRFVIICAQRLADARVAWIRIRVCAIIVSIIKLLSHSQNLLLLDDWHTNHMEDYGILPSSCE